MRRLGIVWLVACSFERGTVPAGPSEDATPDVPTGPEVCNGVDDDRDGSVDEGFALGATCDGMDGDACMEGQVICAPDGTTTICSDTTDTTTEVCGATGDANCDGYAGCADQSCCGDAACTTSGFCCAGNGLVHTASNSCTNDFGTSGSSDELEVYCCGGIARFCLSKEACPWRSGCGAPTPDTCSRSGLSSDAMATLNCSTWQSKTTFNCSPANRIYFP